MAKPSSAKTRRRTNKVRRTQTRRGGGFPSTDYTASHKDRGFGPSFVPSTSSVYTTFSSSRSPLAIALKRIDKAAIREIVASEIKLNKKQITPEEHDKNRVRITHLAEEEKREARRLEGKPSIGDRMHHVRTSARNLRTSAATSARNALNAIKDRVRNVRNSDAVSNALRIQGA